MTNDSNDSNDLIWSAISFWWIVYTSAGALPDSFEPRAQNRNETYSKSPFAPLCETRLTRHCFNSGVYEVVPCLPCLRSEPQVNIIAACSCDNCDNGYRKSLLNHYNYYNSDAPIGFPTDGGQIFDFVGTAFTEEVASTGFNTQKYARRTVIRVIMNILTVLTGQPWFFSLFNFSIQQLKLGAYMQYIFMIQIFPTQKLKDPTLLECPIVAISPIAISPFQNFLFQVPISIWFWSHSPCQDTNPWIPSIHGLWLHGTCTWRCLGSRTHVSDHCFKDFPS